MPIPGFRQRHVVVEGLPISVHIAGRGTPLLLLHGFPQNHMCWEHVAPTLAEDHTVVVADLRGYGDSAAPESRDGAIYAKRVMAAELRRVMQDLGHERFDVLGHDRGARVAYRMALDYPSVVQRLGIIEVVPTAEMWDAFDAALAMKAYHWTHLAQPWPLPEKMIAADPVGYVDHTLASWTREKSLACFSPYALELYRRQMKDATRLHAMCADYRAGATVDREVDEGDRKAGRKIACPLLFVYARSGFPAATGDPGGIWRRWADDLTAVPITSGHFAMEENPEAVLAAVQPFFA